MLCIKNPNLDPYFNIAAEEYLLRKFKEDCFILWRSKPSVIVGKHQNALAEVNYGYIKENDIPVVRRLSGGGTVFHDLGNLNFTFIANGKEGILVDFKKFTQPILDVLNSLSVPAKLEGKNDLRVHGKKISGNAEHVFKNRVLHHGTLLFSSELSALIASLKIVPEKYQDNAVKSIRSTVVNIKEFLDADLDILEFQELIYNHIQKVYPNSVLYEFTDADKEEIEALVIKKYKTWEWNFGYSPQYSLSNKVNLESGFLKVSLDVKKGFVERVKFEGDIVGTDTFKGLEQSIVGVKHEESVIKDKISYQYKNYLSELSLENFVYLFF